MHSNFNDLKKENMTPTEFLQNKNIVAEDKTDLIIGFDNGTKESLIDLLEKYHQAKLKLLGIADVSGSLQAEAVEFAEWIRTFDSLEKKQGFWIVESQISSEDLYKGFLKDRERWRNDR